jgi:hypothetical protein
MTKQKGGMGSAKRVAGADHTIKGAIRKRFQRD